MDCLFEQLPEQLFEAVDVFDTSLKPSASLLLYYLLQHKRSVNVYKLKFN